MTNSQGAKAFKDTEELNPKLPIQLTAVTTPSVILPVNTYQSNRSLQNIISTTPVFKLLDDKAPKSLQHLQKRLANSGFNNLPTLDAPTASSAHSDIASYELPVYLIALLRPDKRVLCEPCRTHWRKIRCNLEFRFVTCWWVLIECCGVDWFDVYK